MAGKGWTTQVAAAAGVAAGTGAAQLGLGYGLGAVAWPVTATADDSVWLGSLGWATWIAASATVFGAMIAARLRGPQAPRPGGPWRFALAAAAAVGALLTVALVAVPARAAVRGDTFAPETIAGGYAVIGILLGLAIAYWAVVSRAVAANLIATAGYLWVLAAAGVVVELVTGRESATYLTSWQFAELGTGPARYGTISWPSAILTLLAALVVGLIAAWSPVRRGHLGVGTASSGAVGPLLVAAVFLALAPQLTPAVGQLESAYLIAPYAVLSGLAGSAVMVAAGQRAADRRAARARSHHEPPPPTATGRAGVPAQPSGAADTHSGGRAGRGRPRPRTGSPDQHDEQVGSAATGNGDIGDTGDRRDGGADGRGPGDAVPGQRSTGRRARRSPAPDTSVDPEAGTTPGRPEQVWAPPASPLPGAASTSPSPAGRRGDASGGEVGSAPEKQRRGLFGRWRRGRTTAPTAVGRASAADPGAAAGPAETPDSGTQRRGRTATAPGYGPAADPWAGTSTSGLAGPGDPGAGPLGSGSRGTASDSPGSGGSAAMPADQRAASGRGARTEAAGSGGQPPAARSTVAAPPTSPTIAKINPVGPENDDQPAATADRPAGGAAKRTQQRKPSAPPAPERAAPTRTSPPAKQAAPGKAAPAKATPAASGQTGATKATPAKTAPARTAPAKAAPARTDPAKTTGPRTAGPRTAGDAVPPSAGTSPQQSSTRPAPAEDRNNDQG